MDDLADLSWTSGSAVPAKQGQSDFDALLSSMPKQGLRPAPQIPAPQQPAPKNPQDGTGDAFESLLPASFGADAQHPMAHAQQKTQASAPKSVDPAWELGMFEQPKPQQPAPKAREASGSLLDLDIFDTPAPRTQPPHPADARGDDDILGDLARPVAKPVAPPRTTASPPPHVVGQLVEMGFSPIDASRALAHHTGDLTAAADALAAAGEAQRPAKREPPPRPQERPAPVHETRPEAQDEGVDWQKQADAIYKHASELGSNVFSRANAFWNNAKAQAQRAIDDTAHDPSVTNIASGLRREAARRWGVKPREREWTGKPRWMAEESAEDESAENNAPTPRPWQRREQPSTPSIGEAQKPAAPTPTAPTAAPTPTPKREPATKVRTEPPQDASAIERAAMLKARGNDEYSRGAYGAAEALYSEALEALHVQSLRRIPVLNNRASARLKNGDSTGAVADSTAVITLIVPATVSGGALMYAPSSESLPVSLSSVVNLRESWAKALLQRASANEAAERWQVAANDWEALAVFERTHGSSVRAGERNRKAASEGKMRCDNMLRPPAPKPVARDAGSSRAAQEASAAGIARVRAQRSAQEAEEAEQLRVKDSVDSRIARWTAGKDGNVRALLSSIDDAQFSLLWPELRWKKVGMHELVTDAQVKRAYTRAISRLHPDKQGSASVEQRMLATGMFHALNSAYCT